MKIKVRHKALRRFAKTGTTRGLPPNMVHRLKIALEVLRSAQDPAEIPAAPWRLHQLQGDLAGRWSMRITTNWRLVFRFEDGAAVDVDLIDYH